MENIKLHIKKKMINEYLNCYKFKNTKKSIYNNDKVASIYYQSLGKNTFITVLYDNKLIFNKSIGHIKYNDIQIKKKQKAKPRNIFHFSQYFVDVFFNELSDKYNIQNVKIYYNCLQENLYRLKKHFFYKYFGRILAKKRVNKRVKAYYRRKKYFKLRFLRFDKNYSNYYNKENRYFDKNYKKNKKSKYKNNLLFNFKNKNKKPKTEAQLKKELFYKFRNMGNLAKNKVLNNKYLIKIKSISFINKYPYNGCKNKKKKKI